VFRNASACFGAHFMAATSGGGTFVAMVLVLVLHMVQVQSALHRLTSSPAPIFTSNPIPISTHLSTHPHPPVASAKGFCESRSNG